MPEEQLYYTDKINSMTNAFCKPRQISDNDNKYEHVPQNLSWLHTTVLWVGVGFGVSGLRIGLDWAVFYVPSNTV